MAPGSVCFERLLLSAHRAIAALLLPFCPRESHPEALQDFTDL